MRMPRFRIRTLMIAVAVVAVILCGARLAKIEQKRKAFRTRAAIHATYGRSFRDAYEKRTAVAFEFPHGPVFARTLALRLAWAEYHESLALKYEHAARYPWLPVEPDPPEPE